MSRGLLMSYPKKIFIVNLYPEAYAKFISISTHLAKQVDTQNAKHRSSHCFLAFTRCPLKLVSNFLLFIEKLNVIDQKGRYEGTVYSIHAT